MRAIQQVWLSPRILDLRVLGIAALGILALVPTYYVLAKVFLAVTSFETAAVHALGLAAVLLFSYEFYFRCQRASVSNKMPMVRATRTVRTRLDDTIPFVVEWVWIYGFSYYLLISLPGAFFVDHRKFILFVAGGVFTLLCSAPIYLLWPTRCPPEWRSYPRDSPSARFLDFIQQFDGNQCCIPSLHVALSAYAATFYPVSAALVIVPSIVAASCLFVKQHSIVDLPPGLMLGFLIGFGVKHLM